MLNTQLERKIQTLQRTIQGTFLLSLIPIGPVVSEKKLEMWKVYRRRTPSDGIVPMDLWSRWIKKRRPSYRLPMLKIGQDVNKYNVVYRRFIFSANFIWCGHHNNGQSTESTMYICKLSVISSMTNMAWLAMYTSLAVRHEIKHVGESISVVVSSSQIPHNFKEHFVPTKMYLFTCLHFCIESLLFLYYLPTVFHTIDFIELFILSTNSISYHWLYRIIYWYSYPPTVFHTIDFIELFIVHLPTVFHTIDFIELFIDIVIHRQYFIPLTL